MPNAGIAQGSIFDIYGSNLGPAQLAQFSGFPVPTAIAGTSVQVTVTGTTVDVYLFFVAAGQIVGVLPSRTPVGNGTLTVTVNGQRSAPAPITVVARSIGLLTLNGTGNGPAAMQMPDAAGAVPLNSLSATIKPGGVGVFFGTGAGAVTFDETRAAPLQDMNADIRAFVGGKPATVLFKGRTPGLVGLDQFNVQIPPDVSGCYVPVALQSGSVVSNFTSISVASSGPCSDPGGLTSQQISGAQSSGSMRVGGVSLVRTNAKFNAGPLGNFDFTQDVGAASFTKIDFNNLIASEASYTTIGACVVYPLRQSQGTQGSSSVTYLDAGSTFNVQGPNGTKQLAKNPAGFSSQLGGGGPAIPGAPAPAPLFLSPGAYTVDNGAGGRDVGAFTATLNIPAPINWTNLDSITTIPRAQNLEITWSGGGPNDMVYIAGTSVLSQSATQISSVGATFFCTAPASAGRFTVPALVMLSLPPSAVVSGIPTGNLLLSGGPPFVNFTAPGIDYGYLNFQAGTSKTVTFQ
jgi:uncharacterized protein (TIGR03437 family)